MKSFLAFIVFFLVVSFSQSIAGHFIAPAKQEHVHQWKGAAGWSDGQIKDWLFQPCPGGLGHAGSKFAHSQCVRCLADLIHGYPSEPESAVSK